MTREATRASSTIIPSSGLGLLNEEYCDDAESTVLEEDMGIKVEVILSLSLLFGDWGIFTHTHWVCFIFIRTSIIK